jgi:hypothetical protein
MWYVVVSKSILDGLVYSHSIDSLPRRSPTRQATPGHRLTTALLYTTTAADNGSDKRLVYIYTCSTHRDVESDTVSRPCYMVNRKSIFGLQLPAYRPLAVRVSTWWCMNEKILSQNSAEKLRNMMLCDLTVFRLAGL